MVFDLDKTFTLYLKACDMFYACKFDKLDMCNNELIHVLPQLRERLACYVCDKLLEKPFTTPSSKCNHFMCGHCRHNHRPFVGACNQCSKWRSLKGNQTLGTIVKGYITICRLIAESPLKTFYDNHSNHTDPKSDKKLQVKQSKRKRKWTILEVIQECVDFPLESSALVLGHSIPSLPPPTQAELEVVPQNENEVTIEEDI